MKHLLFTFSILLNLVVFSQGTSNPAFFVHADKPSSYNGSGTTWSDISGNGHHGTITGATFDPSNKVFSLHYSRRIYPLYQNPRRKMQKIPITHT